jgi:hypothetical protein
MLDPDPESMNPDSKHYSKSIRVALSLFVTSGLLIGPEEQTPLSEDLVLLRNYLLAATAKDLSIFLTVRRQRRENPPKTCENPPKTCENPADWLPASGVGLFCLEVEEASYCVSIRLIDLDPKHVHQISKYVSKKAEWLAALQYWK